jgi:hypothetical protein
LSWLESKILDEAVLDRERLEERLYNAFVFGLEQLRKNVFNLVRSAIWGTGVANCFCTVLTVSSASGADQCFGANFAQEHGAKGVG